MGYDKYQELKNTYQDKLDEIEEKNKQLKDYVENKKEYETCKTERAAYNATLKDHKEQVQLKTQESNTKMIGLGVGCTVLGIILGFLAFRYYKLNTNDANYNDDDDSDDENEDDLERGERNNETSLLENNQPETETE